MFGVNFYDIRTAGDFAKQLANNISLTENSLQKFPDMNIAITILRIKRT